MIKQLILFVVGIISIANANLFSQVVIYSEDFDGALTWTLNTDIGAEGTNPNVWYVSCQEEGVGTGTCGTTCGAGDQTLHVSADAVVGDVGAAYFEIGTGATNTDRRAESADISTVGDVDLTLTFDMIGMGGATDFTEVFYSIDGGATWVSIATPLTSMCCVGGVGGSPCTGAEQGFWQTNSYVLPAECEGIPNLRISFVWKNVDDGVATDPSFAVDNITIEKPVVVAPGGPTALFDPENTTICQGESITYTDLSTTGDVITAWNWVFGGGTPGSAMTVGPHVVTYPTPGAYVTTLTVTDGIGSHDTSFTVTVLDGPYAGESISVDLCEGETLDLNIALLGEDAGGTWVETSGVMSGTFDAVTGILDGTGLTVGDVFTFDYETAAGPPACPGTDIATVTVTIIDCAELFASFLPSVNSLCVGECMTFTDLSTGPITGYLWSFTDPDIAGPIAGADPGMVCFTNVGSFDVTLTVTDGVAIDDTTITIEVNPLPVVTATALATTVCEGGAVTLFGGGDATSFAWTGGAVDGVPFNLDVTTTYTVTGTNDFGCENTAEITITVIACEPLVAGFEYDDIVCVGQCRTFKDTSLGAPVSWFWDFGGAAVPATSTEQNPTVCFETAGIFDVQLTVTNALDETTSTTNSITVFESPTVTAVSDTVIDLGGTAILIATGSIPGAVFNWVPDDYVTCEDCAITTASPPENMVYYVTLVDVNGCSGTDSVRVFVNFIEALGVADIFSPNGDGQNDVLYVQGYGLEAISFLVYNKYGEKVFESNTQAIGWDGTFRGKDENPGVFTWLIEYQFVNGKTGIIKGNTTLVR